MKKTTFPLLVFFAALASFGIYFSSLNPDQNKRKEYTEYISNHPYSRTISSDEVDKLPKKDRPDLAMEQNFLMTIDPSIKDVPTERLIEAFEIQKVNRSFSSNILLGAIPDVVWQERGPNNVGGRTRALMWDPNDSEDKKLWAGGVAGGIWFNNDITDSNSSWQSVDDFLANLAISTLAFDPTNTQVFYAGTGEGYFNADAVRGAGIFKSNDGGLNWSLLTSTENSTFNFVQKIVVTETGTILASTRDGGIQRSIDDGVTWNTVLNSANSGASSSRGNDLEIAQNGDIYATMGIFSTGSIHRSEDDGATWVAITPSGGSPERIELSVAASESTETEGTVIYALASFDRDVSWFKKTSDGGDTWSDLEIPNYRSQNCSVSSDDFTRGQAWYDLTLAVKPTDANVVVAGGINVLKSSDGGTNMAEVSYWTGSDDQTTCDDYVHADVHNIVFRPNHPNEAVIGSDGGVSYSPDLGSESNPTFDTRNNNYNVTQFYAVAAKNAADEGYYLAGAQDNGTQQFTDANGFSTFEVTGGDGAFCFIDQDDSNIQISSYVRNVYYLLNENGNFQATLSNDQNSGRFINPADYDNEADVLYSAGNTNELRRITNISTSPSNQEVFTVVINNEQISALRADADSTSRLFVGTGSGGVYRIDSADFDNPFTTDITGNISDVGYISSIDLGLTDNEIIVTLSNYGVNSIWYTIDGGENWVNKDNDGSLPDIPVRWALFNPNNTAQVMLATELGVWSTDDITAVNPGWEQSSESLANVRCDMLQYREADNQVIVATHGRGVFTSNVFGGPDTDAPLVISLSPEDNAVEVRLDAQLTISFNEPIAKGTGNITLQYATNNDVFETIDVASEMVSISSNVAVIQLNSELDPLEEFRVLVEAGAFVDNSGNPFIGLSGDTWTFTTFDGDEPPTLTSSIPSLTLGVNSDDVVIDLLDHFEDQDGDEFAFSVMSNSNEDLVSTSITNEILTISLVSEATGVADLLIRGTANGKFVEDEFKIVVTPLNLFAQEGSGGSVISQSFPDFNNSEIENADDFMIPGERKWTMHSVKVSGTTIGNVPENAFVRVYSDDQGSPGSLVFQSEIVSIINIDNDIDFLIELGAPLELSTGTYWIAVMVVQEYNNSNLWYWTFSNNGDGFQRRDPNQLLSGDVDVDWQEEANVSLVFTIYGEEEEVIDPPSDLVIEQSASGIEMAWVDNSSIETAYVVERATSGGEFELVETLNENTTTFIDEDFGTNSTLEYRVKAINGVMESTYATGEILSLPLPPSLLDVTDVTFDSFTINWFSEDGATDFVLDVSVDVTFQSFLPGLEQLALSEISHSVTSIEPGTYHFRVLATNASGQSPFSDIGSVTLEVIDPPSDLVIQQTATGIELVWVDNSSNETAYVVERATSGGEFELIETLNENSTTFLDEDFGSNSILEYRVKAIKDVVGSTYAVGEILSIPLPPNLLDVTDITINSFKINWSSDDGATDFVLDVSTDETFQSFLPGLEQFELSEISHSVISIEPGTYHFRVSAANASGTSDFSLSGNITIEPLGLEDFEISTYPNPTSGLVTIEGPRQPEVSLFDLSGKVLGNIVLDKNNQIDLSGFENGTYFLRISSGNKMVTTKVIKR